MDFEEAIAETRDGNRTLLLGNGFSIDWCRDKFEYKSLFEKAELTGLADRKDPLFKAVDSPDFERVMAALDLSDAIAGVYKQDDLRTSLQADAAHIRNGLIEVLAMTHPANQSDIKNEQYKMARIFLSKFSSIFTLNYDSLLYWTYMMRDIDQLQPPNRDGFVNGQWQDWSSPQSISYLHGAFHLYTGSDGETYKLQYSWPNKILDQLKESIAQKKYPLVVTEGTWQKKRARIKANPYLHGRLSCFRKTSGYLFIHGVGMYDNDEHIFTELEGYAKSGLSRIYVSLFGDPYNSDNRRIQDRARAIATNHKTNGGGDIDVKFYLSESAHVWR